jgi:hypothetical protein
MNWFKISQVEGSHKKTLVNKIYRVVLPGLQGIFSDSSWQPVHALFGQFNKMGLNWHIVSANYGGEQPPTNKRWKFEINFTNNKGKPDTIYGTVVAAGAGSVENPLEKYDLSLMMG